ncbi:hypothetical protein KC349_g5054 [Hortaea werneckii]|nr:hypothetical protein KC349_g5054 [Hortaea werneckii]
MHFRAALTVVAVAAAVAVAEPVPKKLEKKQDNCTESSTSIDASPTYSGPPGPPYYGPVYGSGSSTSVASPVVASSSSPSLPAPYGTPFIPSGTSLSPIMSSNSSFSYPTSQTASIHTITYTGPLLTGTSYTGPIYPGASSSGNRTTSQFDSKPCHGQSDELKHANWSWVVQFPISHGDREWAELDDSIRPASIPLPTLRATPAVCFRFRHNSQLREFRGWPNNGKQYLIMVSANGHGIIHVNHTCPLPTFSAVFLRGIVVFGLSFDDIELNGFSRHSNTISLQQCLILLFHQQWCLAKRLSLEHWRNGGLARCNQCDFFEPDDANILWHWTGTIPIFTNRLHHRLGGIVQRIGHFHSTASRFPTHCDWNWQPKLIYNSHSWDFHRLTYDLVYQRIYRPRLRDGRALHVHSDILPSNWRECDIWHGQRYRNKLTCSF